MPLNKVDFERLVLNEGRATQFVSQAAPGTPVDVIAKITRARRSPETDDLAGGMMEDVYILTTTNKEFAAAAVTPLTADRMLFDGEYHLIKATYPLYLQQVLVGYKLQVQG